MCEMPLWQPMAGRQLQQMWQTKVSMAEAPMRAAGSSSLEEDDR